MASRLSRQAKVRFGFDDRIIVGKRVEGLDKDAASSRFGVHVADGAHVHATARIEFVHQADFAFVVAQFALAQAKQLGRDRFQLKVRLIADAAMAFELIFLTPFDLIGHDSPLRWQRLMGRGANFGQRQTFVPPRKHMAAVGDIHLQSVPCPLDCSRLIRLEQFRV